MPKRRRHRLGKYPVRYTGRYVILAGSLKDAWETAKSRSIGPGDWVFPRTVDQARYIGTTGATVIETPEFRRTVDRDAYRAAVAHLRAV